MRELQLPPTIRTAYPNELPQSQENLDNIQRRQTANLVQGFTLKPNTLHQEPFAFFCEINIDNSSLWRLFQAFLIKFPDEVYFIYGRKDDDNLNCGPYKDKFEILNILSPYEIELTQVGFLKFGIAIQTDEYFEEIFVTPAKYMQYWGANPEPFKTIMKTFSLTQIDDLNFIDQYLLVTEALRLHSSNIVETDDLLNHFDGIFRPQT